MNTFNGTRISQIHTACVSIRTEWESLLAECGLRPETNDYTVGIYDAADTLLACASMQRNIMTNVAVRECVRDKSLTNTLVTNIINYASEKGFDNIFVFTKPQYRVVFESLSFSFIGETKEAVMLEKSKSALHNYLSYLHSLRREGRNGVAVMNCNPLTKGHLYLMKEALKTVDTLYIIPVADNPSTEYSYAERVAMLRKATSNFGDIVVCEGSAYTVSAVTFPTYFIKDLSKAADTHIKLDLDIFCRHIAPALNVAVRFVGSEPTDASTGRYNELMQSLLPSEGIEVVQIGRLCNSCGQTISASKVRVAVESMSLHDVIDVLPRASIPFVLAHAASQALTKELMLTPKPGLVDTQDNGSHGDMNVALMQKSIAAIAPVFVRLADMAMQDECPSHTDILAEGIKGESLMMQATNGVNTHKGALFALGLAVVAAARLIYNESKVETEALSSEIALLARRFDCPKDTHGAVIKQRYGVSSALDEAQSGYKKLFQLWLPFYRNERRENGDDEACKRLMLKIMTTLDDTNIYFRCGSEAAAMVKEEANVALESFSDNRLSAMNEVFKNRNISPGGCADMLALTFFIYSITSYTKQNK